MSGRHRTDPGWHRRYLVAGLGAFVVLALLATGAYSLYSVLTAAPQPSRTPAAASTSETSEASQSPEAVQSGSDGSRSPTLAVTVTGARSYLSVRVPDGKVLMNETLHRGQTARFDRPALEVTVGNPRAVRVSVNGKPRKLARGGIDTFSVSRGGSDSSNSSDTEKDSE